MKRPKTNRRKKVKIIFGQKPVPKVINIKKLIGRIDITIHKDKLGDFEKQLSDTIGRSLYQIRYPHEGLY